MEEGVLHDLERNVWRLCSLLFFSLLFACFLFLSFLKEGAEQFLLATKRTVLCSMLLLL